MDETQLKNIYLAYSGGVMSPQEKTDYERDVSAGVIQLPQGASLNTQQAPLIDEGVANAYKSGIMTPEEVAEFEADLNAGKFRIDETVEAKQEPSFLQKAGDFFSGNLRETEQTQAIKDYGAMPELNSFSMASFKSALGSMATNPEETVQIIKANFPKTEIRQDAKGNFIMRSSIDGAEYAIQPGFQMSDIPRAAGAIAAFTPAGGARTLAGQVLGAGATQAGIEGTQAATGGDLDLKEIPTAAALGGGGFLAGKLVNQGMNKILPQASLDIPDSAKNAINTKAPVQPNGEILTPDKLADLTRSASSSGIGSGGARKILAEQSAPDQKTIEAAKRLGIDEYLQPDHVTTNQSYRELAQAVKSVPGSVTRAQEMQGLEEVSKRADDLITEIGGTTDLSRLDQTVKNRLMTIQDKLETGSSRLYGKMREEINPKTPVRADNVIGWIRSRSEELGGDKYLSSMERKVLNQLNEGANPTYARLDDIRKSLTAARVKKQGAFKDAETGLIKKIESELLKDQRIVAEKTNNLGVFNAARQSVAVRKGIEDDLKALYGRELSGSLVGDLSRSVKQLASGDASKFINLIKATPNDMREEVTATGLNIAFGKSAKNGSLNFTNYANWYEGLLNNKKAYNAIMSNLPQSSRKQLSDLYRVSKGISSSGKERIMTGRIQAVRDELKGADTLIGNIYDAAKRSSVGLAAEAVTTPLGIPGAGIASGISSALTKGKSDTLKAADALISSPEFIEMTRTGTKDQAKKLTKTSAFSKFMNSLTEDQKPSNPEQWIISAFQSQQQFNKD
jgi:hypothetical protein